MSAHTPTPRPWVAKDGHSETNTFIWQTGGDLIASVITEANAAHIVKCVNAHDDLVEALRALLGEVHYMEGRVGWAGNGGREKARSALAKAGVS